MSTQKLNNCAQSFDSLKGSFYITDKNSTVVYAHQSLEKKTGFSIGEIVGKRPSELWGGNMEKEFYKYMWKVIKKKKKPFVSPVHNINKDASTKKDILHIAPVYKEDKKIEYFIEVHPSKQSNKEKFQSEFQKMFCEQKKHGAHIMSWLVPWMADTSDNTQAQKTIDAQVKKENSFSSLLFNSFVFPTRLKYQEREDDKQLITKAQHNPEFFQRLYLKYYHHILYYFLHRLNNEKEISEELAQETFFKAFQHIPSFQITNASYKTYLLRIAHNLLVNFYRTRKTISLEDREVQLVQTRIDYERIIMKSLIADGIQALKQKDQQVIDMKYNQELSIREIATVLQKTENAVKLQLSRARKKLKKIVRKE